MSFHVSPQPSHRGEPIGSGDFALPLRPGEQHRTDTEGERERETAREGGGQNLRSLLAADGHSEKRLRDSSVLQTAPPRKHVVHKAIRDFEPDLHLGFLARFAAAAAAAAASRYGGMQYPVLWWVVTSCWRTVGMGNSCDATNSIMLCVV